MRNVLLARVVALLALAVPASGAAKSAAELERYPLSPPDMSSPERTLNAFLTETTGAVDAYLAGDRELMSLRADRAIQTLGVDLPRAGTSGLPRATENALLLLEILARTPLPPDDQVPGGIPGKGELPASWTIPKTELRLVRVEGQAGEPATYRFSPDTVSRLPEFHRRVRDLPASPRLARYDGVVERYRLGPGLAAPDFFVAFVQRLPSSWFKTIGGAPVWKWPALAISLLTALILFKIAHRLTAALERSAPGAAGHRWLASPLLAVFATVLVAVLRHWTVDVIGLTGTRRAVTAGVMATLYHLAWIWLIFVFAGRAADVVNRIRAKGVYALDSQLMRLVFRLVAVVLATFVVIHLGESLGVSVAPMIAGLGVGGLAVALAVRPTLENVIGGFILFADAPVRVGEFCRFGDKLGTIEAIGLRSVRVRGLDRTVITVPNADFCQLQLVNFTRRDSILLQTTLHLRYETTADQLRLVLARLRELLIRHPRVSPDPARVRFVGYGDSSLDLEIFAFVQTRDFSEFLAIQEDLNLRIKDIVEACGSGFAFPSRTLYVERSNGLDAELARAAETEVARWRAENQLPFPEFDERVRSEMSDTLDYPPEGSPGRPSSGGGHS